MQLLPYMFVLPAVLIYSPFVLVPLARLIVMSFWRWNGLTSPTWVGLKNYAAALSDPEVWNAIANNGRWVALAIVPIVVGLALAIILDQAKPRGRTLYRAIYFLPYTLPAAISALIWTWIYNPSWGSLNAGLDLLHLSSLTQVWLGDPKIALVSLAMAANWSGYGFCMMLFLAGLASVDRDLYDASRVDGANAWQQFRHVTIPGIANTLNVVVLIVFIATVRVFDFVFVMTAGGPAGATDVLGMKIYRESFMSLNAGYGAAIAVMTALVILACSWVYLRIREATA
jgi:ABC-type sugar transport system permease subunit